MKKPIFIRNAALLLGLVMGVTTAFGQVYPSKAVRVLVGYAPGGSPDAVGRMISEYFSKLYGQPFVVENKPGATGMLATNLAAQSPADGYTLLVAESGQIEIAPQMVKAGYDVMKDFTYIGQITRTPLIIVSSAKGTRIRNMADLMSAAKASPGKVTYGTSGIGSGQHLTWEVLRNKAGIDIKHIPYKGAAQMVPALIAGEVDMMMGTYGSFASHLKAGTVFAVALASNARSPYTPDIAAVSEAVKGFEDFSSETGLMGPRGLPLEIVSKLSEGIRSGLDNPEVKARMETFGLGPRWTTPAAYQDLVRANLKKYEEAIKISKIQPE